MKYSAFFDSIDSHLLAALAACNPGSHWRVHVASTGSRYYTDDSGVEFRVADHSKKQQRGRGDDYVTINCACDSYLDMLSSLELAGFIDAAAEERIAQLVEQQRASRQQAGKKAAETRERNAAADFSAALAWLYSADATAELDKAGVLKKDGSFKQNHHRAVHSVAKQHFPKLRLADVVSHFNNPNACVRQSALANLEY